MRPFIQQRFLALLGTIISSSFLSHGTALAALTPGESVVPGKHATLQTISKISSEFSEKISIINISLSQGLKNQDLPIQEHGSFIQFELPNTITTTPGEFLDVHSPFFSKLITLQVKPTTTAIRIFTTKDAKTIKENTNIDILNDRVVLSINHLAFPKEPKATATSAAQLSTETTVKKRISAEQAKPAPLKSLGLKDDFAIETYLKKIAILSIVGFLLLLFVLTMKRITKNRKILGGPSPRFEMQTLSDLVLAPKQKLSLIQVGETKLLLAISPDNVSLLTKFEETKPTPNIQEHLSKSRNIQKIAQPPNVLGEPPIRKSIPSKPKSREAKRPRADKSFRQHLKEGNMETKRINYAIDDHGIHNSRPKEGTQKDEESTKKAIEDVTHLIREKLKSLPKI